MLNKTLQISTIAMKDNSDSGETKKERKTNFEDAMTETGFGKFNIYSVLYCGFMLLGMIMETLGFSYIIPASQCDLELTLTQKTWISIIPFIAIIVTSHMWGYLADTQGRKKILLICTTVGSIASMLSSFSPNTATFGVVRFIAGIFIAGPSALGYAYLGELNPKAQRDMMLTLGNASVGFGTAVVPLIAWGVLPLDFHWNLIYLDYRPWRLLICIFAMPYLICAICMFKFPESPKFLASRGRDKEALEVLRDIYSLNTGKSRNDFPITSLITEGVYDATKKKSFVNDVWYQTIPLFRKDYIKYTALTCYLQFVVFASTNGFYIWFPVVINKLLNQLKEPSLIDANLCTMFSDDITHAITNDNSTNLTVAVCNDTLNTGAFTITTLLSCVVCVLTVTAAFTIRFIGKKTIVCIIFLLTSVAGFILEWISGTLLAICLFSIIQANGVCIGVINAYVVEIFPTHVRAMAVCLTLMIGRVGSMFGSYIIGYLLHTNCSIAFFLFSFLIFTCFGLCFCLPKSDDTKSRKKTHVTEDNGI